MRLLIIAALVLMVSSLAIAIPETRQMDPFTVSFDLNTDINYQINPLPSKGDSFAIFYPLEIKMDNTTGALITITEYKNPQDSTLQMQGSLAFWKMRGANGLNASVPQNKTIGKKEGFIISGVPFPGSDAPEGYKLYHAQYWLDSKGCECCPLSVGTISVDITSNFPEDITMSLLNSLQIEKTGQASQPMPSGDKPAGDMPPGDMPPQG